MSTAARSCAPCGWARCAGRPAGGRAFVASGDSLLLLGARNGAGLRAVPTGIGTLAGDPVAMAVDERLSGTA